MPVDQRPGRRGSDLRWWIAGGLLLGVFLLYSPGLRHPFVGFDDPGYVTENPLVLDGLTLEGLAWALEPGHAGNWHPLTWLSHMLDCQLFGSDQPGRHHLTNLLLHVVNALLMFVVLERMTGARWRPAFVAMLFALLALAGGRRTSGHGSTNDDAE